VNQLQYQRAVLDAWLELPSTAARRPSAADRALALQLWRNRTPLFTVLLALKLADFRLKPADGSETPPAVRSLRYFQPIVEELLHTLPAYRCYLAARLGLSQAPASVHISTVLRDR
jgi:hypothetical protein